MKNLISSEYVNKSDLPEQVKRLFGPLDEILKRNMDLYVKYKKKD